APGNILCPAKQTGLSKDSVANISQVVTVDKVMLTEKAGELSLPLMRQIEAGLRLILAL
ncbi:MAG TPA: type II toxin-antitoxin system PemK/MazF family toxin, partial [Anaerolineae bacterium]|nr:type II toxin-antitoxin system PemK/MazF family toxin [Anaerolineae bacterium]